MMDVTLQQAYEQCIENGHIMVDTSIEEMVAPGVIAKCLKCDEKLRIYQGKAMGTAYSTSCRIGENAFVEPVQVENLKDSLPNHVVGRAELQQYVQYEEASQPGEHYTGQWLYGIPVYETDTAAPVDYAIITTNDHPVSLNQWRDTVHQYAKDKGWWDDDVSRNFGDLMSLLHTEISEAYEEYRNGHEPNEIYYSEPGTKIVDKPEGIPVELADLMIRLFDLFGYYNIDIEAVVHMKHQYNLTRPYRHGGKRT